jgi:hypothetical protein
MLGKPRRRVWASLALAFALLATTGCEYGLENQITDTVWFALEIVDIWV